MMKRRYSWKSTLRLSLVTIPVRAYTATEPAHGRIHFHQLHEKCKSRIRYAKTCPIHGEVTKDEIVPGYEYTRGKYVVLSPEELDSLRTDRDKSISIDAVIRPDQIDPIYYTDKSYYLAPDGKPAEKPFTVVQRALVETEQYAIAHAVIMRQDHVVLLRPADGLFVLTALNYEAQVKEPSEFSDEAPKAQTSHKELELAKTLIESSRSDDFDFSDYRDTYTEKLKELIEAKIKGKEVLVEHEEETPRIINLMDALRKSVAETSSHEKGRSRTTRPVSHKRKRKTG
jgi:DNA end-binding protein Ku